MKPKDPYGISMFARELMRENSYNGMTFEEALVSLTK